MSLFRLVAELLTERGIPFAAIGAAALARHGVSRSTFDVDLLATDPRTLDASLWDAPSLSGTVVEVRRGDLLDPLAGVVRVRNGGERPVDLVVGRSRWQDEAIGRGKPARILDAEVLVVTAPDLVLLKLYAGGPQDAWDIRQLLEGDADGSIARAVDSTLGALSADAAALWRRIREG